MARARIGQGPAELSVRHVVVWALWLGCAPAPGSTADVAEGEGEGESVADTIPDEGWAPPAPPGGAEIPLSDVHLARAAATCEALTRCGATAVIEERVGEDCVAGLEHQIRQLYGEAVAEAVNAGRVAYDGEAAWRCAQGTLWAPCRLFETEPSCAQVFEGLIPPGGACDIDLECAGPAWCDASAGCPGVCAPSGGHGSPCTADRHCAGLASCRLGTCQRKLSLGSRCSPDGAECLGLLTCGVVVPGKPARFCRNPFEGLDAGALCRPGGCGAGLYCRFAVDGAHRCVPRRPEGDPCFHGFPNACVSGRTCDWGAEEPRPELEGRCVASPTEGEACWVDCAPGHVCLHSDTLDGAPGRCHVIRDNGQACDRDEQCWSLACAPTGVCRARVRACPG